MGAEKDPAFRKTTRRQAENLRVTSVFNDRRESMPKVSKKDARDVITHAKRGREPGIDY